MANLRALIIHKVIWDTYIHFQNWFIPDFNQNRVDKNITFSVYECRVGKYQMMIGISSSTVYLPSVSLLLLPPQAFCCHSALLLWRLFYQPLYPLKIFIGFVSCEKIYVNRYRQLWLLYKYFKTTSLIKVEI